MKFENQTHYLTKDLRRIVLAGLKAMKVPLVQGGRKMSVRISYNRRRDSSWHGGSAHVGRSDLVLKIASPAGAFVSETPFEESLARYETTFGRRMILTLPRDDTKLDVAEFARTVLHEILHLKGVRHGEMTPNQRWCRGPAPAWAEGLAIGTKPTKPMLPREALADARREKRVEHLRDMVRLWEMRSKRAKTIGTKWKRKLAAAEQRAEERMAAKGEPS